MGKPHGRRRCPKCGGNLFLFNDYTGWYEQCLQCSYTINLDVVYDDGEKVDLKKAPLVTYREGNCP